MIQDQICSTIAVYDKSVYRRQLTYGDFLRGAFFSKGQRLRNCRHSSAVFIGEGPEEMRLCTDRSFQTSIADCLFTSAFTPEIINNNISMTTSHSGFGLG